MLKLLDKLAIKWIIKRNIFQTLTGDFGRVIKTKARTYFEELENVAWTAQTQALTIRRNTWDTDCVDNLLSNLSILYHHIHDENLSLDDANVQKQFFEKIMDNDTTKI